MRRALVPLVVAGVLVACGGPRVSPTAPLGAPGGGARCKLAAGGTSPLVTEWSAPEKARLEAQLGRGPVAVEWTGCSLRLLTECEIAGAYRWRRTTLSTDALELRDADELYAKLPLGALGLEGELSRSGRLSVRTVVSGQFELGAVDTASAERRESCARTTHLVAAVTVGAYELHSGWREGASGGAEVPGAGAGAGSARSEVTLRRAGDARACAAATDSAPSPECASPIQIFLRPLARAARDLGPPGTLRVRFAAPDTARAWRVVAGGRTLCAAPCEAWVDPAEPIAFRAETSFGPLVRSVPALGPLADAESVEVREGESSTAELALGIVGTALGGIGVMAGAGLTFAGCAADRGDGLCTAGAIVLGVSPLVLASGIYAIVDSSPGLEAVPGPGAAPPGEPGRGR